MMSWEAFLKNPKNAFEVFIISGTLNDYCQLQEQGDIANSQEAAELTNMRALRLVAEWFSQPLNNNDILQEELSIPFYKSISRAAVLIALGPDSGLSPDTIGLDSKLNEIADFSSGTLVRRYPN